MLGLAYWPLEGVSAPLPSQFPHRPRNNTQHFIHIRLGVVLAEREPERTGRRLMGAADCQQRMAGGQRLSGTRGAGGGTNAVLA